MATRSLTLNTGSNLSQLDIYITDVNDAPVAASGVSWDLYDAAGTLAAEGPSLNPSTGTYTGSGVVPAGFQLGDWRIEWDITYTDGTIVEASETFCVQPPTVNIGFTPAVDKTASIYTAVQIDVGDPDGAYINEALLKRVLVKAVRRLNQKLGTAVTFRGPVGVPGQFGGRRINVIEIEVDVENGTLTPNNDEVCDLVILQMEYIILTSELNALKRLNTATTSGPFVTMVGGALNDDVMVRNADGVTVKKGASRMQSRASLFRFSVEEARRELDMAVRMFLNRLSGNFGKLIW